MEKGRRTRKRITVGLVAELILDGKNYTGVIENISESGIKWYQYAEVIENISEYGISMRTTKDFTPGKTLKLKFQLPSGEKLNLHCKIIWSHKTPPHGLTKSMGIDPPSEYTAMGLEIIRPPLKYKKFFKTLQ